jgi:hypothetical protein
VHFVHGTVPEHYIISISAIVNSGIDGSNLRFSLLALSAGNRNIMSLSLWW